MASEEKMDSYRMIRQQIIKDIDRGTYPPGEMIPKQVELAEKYAVSRGTIRKALDDLIHRGILITTKRKGTVVADFQAEHRDEYRPLSFSASKRVEENVLVSKVIEIRMLQAEPWMASILGTSVGASLYYLRRVRILGGQPENYQCSYFSCDRLGALDLRSLDLEHASLFDAISRQSGLYAMKKKEDIRAVCCPEFAAGELHLQPGDPVLLIMRTVYAQDGLVLEYCEDYECTDRHGLVIETEGEMNRSVILNTVQTSE